MRQPYEIVREKFVSPELCPPLTRERACSGNEIVNKRISTPSSDRQTFEDAAPVYQNALGHSNFSHKLKYTPHETQRPRRNRQRNVIWFNPPFSKNVKTNIARSFLHLVNTHFPAGHKLHKIFNRNTVKVSYSCMNNVRSIITTRV